jgi:hypothetical protein
MAVFNTGQSTDTTGLQSISVSQIPDGVSVLKYHSYPLVWKIFSPAQLTSIMQGWQNLKNSAVEKNGGTLVEILGVKIDTESGEVFVKVNARYIPAPTITIGGKQVPATTSEAGLNPLAVVAIAAGLFAALDIGLTLMQVYTGKAGIDPCKVSGVIASAQCAATRGFWIIVGIAVGIAFLTIVAAKHA